MTPDTATLDRPPADDAAVVRDLVARARTAMAAFADAGQERVDDAVTALAWSIYEPGRARELAEIAVACTGLGRVEDKITKNRRKTFGTLRDLLRVKSVGMIELDAGRGIAKYAKPVGVVAAVTPSTNPTATPVNKAMMAVKGRNAIVVAPSPSAFPATAKCVEYMRAELARIGAPADLVQILPQPITKERTNLLMQSCDLVVVTGSQANVRAAYRSGRPAIGVGAGNVPVIVDETADLADAAAKIRASKCFDNATSCSSENSLVIVDAVWEAMLEALRAEGGWLAGPGEKERIRAALWVGGKLNRRLIAKDPDVFAREVGLPEEAQRARFFMVEETGVGPDHPFSGEKLSLVLTLYRVPDFGAAIEKASAILEYQGKGHSVGLHTRDPGRPHELARRMDVVRVLVNQAHTFGNGGGFDNGLPFTLSMGCGTWQGNSISENLNWRHFVNITHLALPIPEDRPDEEALFGRFWRRYGR